MSLKEFGAKLLAKHYHKKISQWKSNPLDSQKKTFQKLIQKGKDTQFGKDHKFGNIKNIDDFQKLVPVGDYELLKPYIEQILDGKQNVLWPGKPKYFAKTSGTTSGAKLIPITKESSKTHSEGAKMALLEYINETQNTGFVNGKMIFLQGSPVLEKKKGILTGRLSGISAHMVPNYLQKNRLPSYATNSIEDWETKVDAIVAETKNENMTLISGIPSWIIMYYEKLLESSKKNTVSQLFKNLGLFVYGGVAFEPYKERLNELVGKQIDSIELFPASEGFIAFQDKQGDKGMLLNLANDIFYEFIHAEEYFNEDRKRLTLKDVELGKNYALILNSSAGLWGYDLGDTVQFTSLKPYKVVVSGRIKHFTSAFGEHVIASEVENSLNKVSEKFNVKVNEFHVAPQVNPKEGLPYHEWFLDADLKDADKENFSMELDREMCEANIYYKDLISGGILKPLVITLVKSNAFNEYMKSIGKLGGQNKLPRLSNDRKIADALEGHLQ